MRIEVVIGNITRQPDAQALVNSANANLRLGSGVAGAIHTAAGLELEAYCRVYAPLALGASVITPGFGLPNPWVIHVRAPHFLNDDEPETMYAKAISTMMDTIRAKGIESVAIPAIGTGVFRFAPVLAASIMARVMYAAERDTPALGWARICVVNAEMQTVFETAFQLASGEDIRRHEAMPVPTAQ
jgi:O-acetyl-ADP-ribose deacetylase (regulator of RNase III)